MNGKQSSYLLMTPGPLSTTLTVKAAMMRDLSTWDEDYYAIVSDIRNELVRLATDHPEAYTCVLMQGSGTFGIEAVLGTAVPKDGHLLILANGSYGLRMGKMAETLGITHQLATWDETEPVPVHQVRSLLASNPPLTHVAMVHVETTTGIINPIEHLTELAHEFGKVVIVDAMSSFGGIPLDVHRLKVDFLVSSANKCIQGVPGFSFVIARKDIMPTIAGNARSVSLDLYDQWYTMESENSKWRFTSPTHTVLAFHQALLELSQEGGIVQRYERYRQNQARLSSGMAELGFTPLLPPSLQSPIITTFLYPADIQVSFDDFYHDLKTQGFVIYPGKLTVRETLRVGSIGQMDLFDVERFLVAVGGFLERQRRNPLCSLYSPD